MLIWMMKRKIRLATQGDQNAATVTRGTHRCGGGANLVRNCVTRVAYTYDLEVATAPFH